MAEQGRRGVMGRACMAGAIGWMIVLDSAKEVQGPICGRGSNTNGWNHLETWFVAKSTRFVLRFIKGKNGNDIQRDVMT